MNRTVIIPTPGRMGESVARSALKAENVDHRVVMLGHDPLAYGSLVGELWRAREGFVIVEDDIAPWPRAIDRLLRCDQPWCRHDYPIGAGLMGHGTLGCIKVSDEVVQANPDAYHVFERTDWRQLDSVVLHAITAAIHAIRGHGGHVAVHTHMPPVAHAQGLRP